MSILSDISDELHRLAEHASAADQPDPLAEASRSLPARVRDLLTEFAGKLAAELFVPAPPAEAAPAEPEPGAEPPAGDTPPEDPGAVG